MARLFCWAFLLLFLVTVQSRSGFNAEIKTMTSQNTQRDVSELDLAVGTNASLLIEDNAGRRTGRDHKSGRVIQEIPRSAYFEDAMDDDDQADKGGGQVSHQIQISRPAGGLFHLTLTGIRSGPYELSIRGFSNDGTPQT